MSDKRPEDQDNEPTRIVQRPGPQAPVRLGPGQSGGASQGAGGATPVAPRIPAEPPPIQARPAAPFEPAGGSADPDATRVAAKPRLTPPGQPFPRGAQPVAPAQPLSPHVTPPPPPPPSYATPAAPPPPSQGYAPSEPPVYAPPPAPAAYQPPPPPAPAAYQAPPPPPAPMEPKPAMAEKPVMAEKPALMEKPAPARRPVNPDPVVGWVVVIKGPGRGSSREVYSGRNSIGADPDQLIPIDFGDPAFARRGHAFIVYDNEAREFFVEDGKQKELVRLNGRLLSETTPMHHGDEIRIGATTLKFVALCGPEFDWADQNAPKSDAPAMTDKAAMTPKETMAPKEVMAPKEMMAPKEAMAPRSPAAWDEPMAEEPMAPKPMVDDAAGEI